MGGQSARNSKHSGADRLSGFSQDEGLSTLGPGQYGWPECNEFQAFWGGQAVWIFARGFECLRAGSVRVANTQGIPSILGADGGKASRHTGKQEDMREAEGEAEATGRQTSGSAGGGGGAASANQNENPPQLEWWEKHPGSVGSGLRLQDPLLKATFEADPIGTRLECLPKRERYIF